MTPSFNLRIFLILLASLLTSIPLIAAQTCNATSLCPSTAPCCSEYGYCGSGSYCLGGCEPLYSHSLTSCRPDPLCVDTTTYFGGDSSNLNRVLQNGTAYDGNATEYDWVVNSGSLVPDPNGQGVRLILTEGNGGTKISSTRYIHYGIISFELEASKWAGVVTAAITMSDVKDEIDWEWPGTTTDAVQTNYWFLGVANYSATEGASVSVSNDTSSNFHTYTFDWQEDQLNWLVDGIIERTVLKNETLSADGSKYQYPSTPSRVQISIWPAGVSTCAQGTIEWAGGLIDWNDEDYTTNGYFWNTLQSVTITCAGDSNESSGGNMTGWAYVGNDTVGVPTVNLTTASFMLSASRSAISSIAASPLVVFTIGVMFIFTGFSLL